MSGEPKAQPGGMSHATGKVSGRTKTELRKLHRQVDSGLRPRRRNTVGAARASLPFVPTMTVPFLPLSFCGPLA
jgi:hypothetical protein